MPDYMITRTRLTHPNYDGAVPALLPALGLSGTEEWKACREGLVVLRSTVMDPFLTGDAGGTDHVAGYVAALRRACADGDGRITPAA